MKQGRDDTDDVCVDDEQEFDSIAEFAQDSIAYSDLSRRDVRALIFYLLYAAEAFDYQESLEAIVDNFNRGFGTDIPADSEVVHVARAVIEQRDSLDNYYKPLLSNWRFERIGVSTKLILRFAVWEFMYTTTDSRIIINEAVELAKRFAEKDAYKFVNGILDRLVKEMPHQKPLSNT